jgi:thiol-disulfide isomerase/thioredoxin
MRNLLAFMLSLALSFSALWADQINFRELSFKEALKASQEEDKPVFIDCYTDWCGPCKWMSANIFTDDKVAKFYNQNFICIKIDMEKNEGPNVAKDYGIKAYPTLLYLDGNGKELFVKIGAAQETESYIRSGEAALSEERNLIYLQENVDGRLKDSDFMENYFYAMGEANRLNPEVVSQYFHQFDASEWAEPKNWTILKSLNLSFDDTIFKQALEMEVLFTEKYGQEATDFFRDQLFYDLGNRLYRARNEEAISKFGERRKKVFEYNFSGKKRLAFELKSVELQKEENFDDYAKHLLTDGEAYYWDEADQLNNMAWTIYENVEDPQLLIGFLAWAKRSLELDRQHHTFDTYAHLLFATGNYEEALRVQNEAIALAREQGQDDTSDYEAFVEEILAKKAASEK